jgi:hypothetical protein
VPLSSYFTLDINCTKYCSERLPNFCRATASELIEADRSSLIKSQNFLAEQREALRIEAENKQIENDKAECSKYGIAENTEAMSYCLLRANETREQKKLQQQQLDIQQQQLHQLKMQQQQQMYRSTTTNCRQNFNGSLTCNTH